MKRFTLFLIFNITLIVSSAQEKEFNLAILDFHYLSGSNENRYLERAVPELLITDFAMSKKIRLVERSRLIEIMNELNLSMSGVINKQNAVEAGKMAGANSVILGTIVSIGSKIRIDCRLTDVETSEIMLAEKVECSNEDDIIQNIDLLAVKMIKLITGEDIEFKAPEKPENLADKSNKALAFETVMNNRYRLQGDGAFHYLQIDIYSKDVKKENRVPLNLALVLDRSGSMAGDKLENVKKAAEFVLTNCQQGDYISLVTYETGVQVPITATGAENALAHIKAVRSIANGGGTNLSGGLFEGFEQAKKYFKKGRVNRILLLSDGQANEGITNLGKLRELTKQKSSDGISVSSFGVGANYNEKFMAALATAGRGNYYFISKAEEIGPLFSKEMKGLLAVAAQDVQVIIQTEKGTTVEEIYGYEPQQEGNSTIISLGDIFARQLRTIIIRLKVPVKDENKIYKTATVTYAYDDVTGSQERVREAKVLEITYTNDINIVADNENSALTEQIQTMQTARKMEAALDLMSRGKIAEASQQLAEEKVKIQSAFLEYQSVKLKKQLLTVEKYRWDAENYRKMDSQSQKLLRKSMHLESIEMKQQVKEIKK